MGLDIKQVRKPIRKLRKLLKKMPKAASPDQVHALRTNSRRLEALISSLALGSGREPRRLLKHVARLRKSAGTVRDMDVLTGFVASLEVDGEQNCKLQLLEHLASERQKHARKLDDVVARKGQRARPLLKRISRQLELALREQQEGDCDPASVNARAAGSALALETS